jgi:preprotein translocase subunit SecY
MLETLKNAWKIADLRKKILYTLGMLLIYRLLCYVPTPGVDTSLIASALERYSLLGFINSMTGSDLSNYTIMAMGITPYINASIIMQLLCVAIPKLEEMQKEGEEGRKKIAQITRYVTVGLGFIQAIALTIGLHANATNGFLGLLTIGFCLAAGTAIAMWMGERITENGIGNGISLLIFAGIISNLARSVGTNVVNIFSHPEAVSIPAVIASVVVFVILVVGIVLVDLAERRIRIQYAKRMVGRKMYGGQSTHIPLKVNQAGVIPIIFASSLLQVPATIAYMVPNSGYAKFIEKYFSVNGNPGFWVYFVFEIILIIAFTYFYGTISVNPPEIADNLKNNGGFIPGIRPGRETAKYLVKICGKLTIVSAIFLALVAAMPTLLQHWSALAIGFGGTSLIIAVGVALDTQRAVETQLQMRNYSGFLK